MAPPLLVLEDIILGFGGQPLLDHVSMMISQGDRIALVGRNGSGKSTLLKIAAGLIEPQDGRVFRQPSATVRYLPQMPDLGGYGRVADYAGADLGPADDAHRASYLLDALSLDGDANPATLSGGEARRAALARVLAPKPDILLLDEPTNHLDITTIEWLEQELAQGSSALVTISHDRRFLERVSRSTVWLDRGQARLNTDGFGTFEVWRDTVLEAEEREQHKLGRQIVREEHWLRYGVTARRKRNMRRLGELQALRARHRSFQKAEGKAKLATSESARSGKLVIEAEGLSKQWDGRAVVSDFSIRIARGDRIGLVGPNGAGKTTLLTLLTGALAPDEGLLRHGTNLQIATLDQTKATLPLDDTLAHYLTDGRGDNLLVNGALRHVTGYMKDFLFKPEQARTPIRELSGGERARLMLARLLARPANLLVLDEPTNDLDMETLDLLQELVAGFDGTVLLVSHDRDFLDRTVTSTIAPSGDGCWIIYAGGYSDMLKQRGAQTDTRRGGGAKPQRREPTKPREAAQPRAGKLSYKQKYALETLPGEIEALNTEINEMEEAMADPQLYARDADGFAALARSLEEKRATLAAKEEQWLELELLREEIGA